MGCIVDDPLDHVTERLLDRYLCGSTYCLSAEPIKLKIKHFFFGKKYPERVNPHGVVKTTT